MKIDCRRFMKGVFCGAALRWLVVAAWASAVSLPAHAAADGVDSVFGLLALLLAMALPVILLVVTLGLLFWGWRLLSARRSVPAPEGPRQRSDAAVAAPTPIAVDAATSLAGAFWRSWLGWATLAFAATVFVIAPAGQLMVESRSWMQHSSGVMSFMFGPGLYLPYLALAVGLVLWMRAGSPWAVLALLAISIVWLLLISPNSTVAALNAGVYRKLADPSAWNYLALIVPAQHRYALMLALVWLPATLLAPGAYGPRLPQRAAAG